MERKCVKLLQLNSRNNPIGQQVLTYFKIGQLGIGPKAGLFLYKQLSSCFCIQRKQSTARSKLVKPASRFSLIENIFRWGEGSFVPRNVPQTSNRLHPTCWCRKQSFLTLCLPRIERNYRNVETVSFDVLLLQLPSGNDNECQRSQGKFKKFSNKLRWCQPFERGWKRSAHSARTIVSS